jgi:hypothetical protein
MKEKSLKENEKEMMGYAKKKHIKVKSKEKSK